MYTATVPESMAQFPVRGVSVKDTTISSQQMDSAVVRQTLKRQTRASLAMCFWHSGAWSPDIDYIAFCESGKNVPTGRSHLSSIPPSAEHMQLLAHMESTKQSREPTQSFYGAHCTEANTQTNPSFN